MGTLNTPGWTYGEVDFEALDRLRVEGDVRTMTHWIEQPGAGPDALPKLRRVSLL
jgi:hypothetical protein